MEKIKPCPFCGNKDITFGDDIFWMECSGCGAFGPTVRVSQEEANSLPATDITELAVKLWNSRGKPPLMKKKFYYVSFITEQKITSRLLHPCFA